MPTTPLRSLLSRLGFAVVAALTLLPTEDAMAYEEPRYEVIQSSEAFELRRYPALLVAETDMPGGREAGSNVAFRRLFDYITGGNRRQQKIEMTVPVVMGPPGQRIEMTVPVITQPGSGAADTMQFVLPASFTPESAPQPTDAAVRVRQLPPQWLAVRRYSGRVTDDNFREAVDALMPALKAAGLTATGPAQMAVYNGPFTPWFLRRNEALVPVAPPGR